MDEFEKIFGVNASLPAAPVSDKMRMKIWFELRDFMYDDQKRTLVLQADLRKRRRAIHSMADLFGLGHRTLGNGSVLVRKEDRTKIPSELIDGVVVPRLDGSWSPEEVKYWEQLNDFVRDKRRKTLNFPTSMSSEERAVLHDVVSRFKGLDHDTFGSKNTNDRYMRITKVDPAIQEERDKRLALFHEAVRSRPSEIELPSHQNLLMCETLPHFASAMAAMALGNEESYAATPKVGAEEKEKLRCVSWNIQMMDVILDNAEKCKQVAQVILDLNACVIGIQEGPGSMERMQAFLDKYLPQYDVYGALEHVVQQLYFLVKRDGPLENVEVYQPAIDRLSQPWQFDVKGDLTLAWHKYVRRPLVIRGTLRGSKETLFLCNMHMKSKKVRSKVKQEEGNHHEKDPGINMIDVASFICSRRKLGAECFHLRECLTECIMSNFPDAGLIVLGDLNSGPGSDFFARYYLLFDVVDVLLGSPFDKRKKLYSVLISHEMVKPEEQWSTCFRDVIDKRIKRLLVDHIFVNKVLKYDKVAHAGIAHDVFGQNGRPSDHTPVYMDIKLKREEQ